MNYIIFDLEATCWEHREKEPNEIIEIGAVKIDNNKIVDEFSIFIKPIKHEQLSDFCKILTSIQQTDVDEALEFPEALNKFKDWIGDDYILCSWGLYDKKQLDKDCILHNLDTVWSDRHISLKHQYNKIKKIKRRVGVKKALSMEGLKFEGVHHRGIDDARNIARIFIKNLDKWTILD